ncbi:hypothetical protein DFH06DRAFT_122032 [Mycena polygramma]|nr:hypothetical protein DFH06DRAFT_122032 [Mycena polygramma]
MTLFVLRFSRTLCVQRAAGGRRLFSDALFPAPPKPKGWPTPWITESDANDYLFPLYAQGWYVAAVNGDTSKVRTAGLACRFAFPSCTPAVAFVKDVLTLTETENHHPHWLRLINSSDDTSVHICSTTHSALRPEWDATDTLDSRSLAGITLRDLRFAALISSLPSNTYRPAAEVGPSRTRPTWDDLCESLRFWSRPNSSPPAPARGDKLADGVRRKKTPDSERIPRCAACGDLHLTADCPTRHDVPPPPCSICHGLHWRVDCPVRRVAERKDRTLTYMRRTSRKTPEYSERGPPPHPCPVCKGDHWKVDCRAPQAPSSLLEKFKLPVPAGTSPESSAEPVDK